MVVKEIELTERRFEKEKDPAWLKPLPFIGAGLGVVTLVLSILVRSHGLLN